MSDDYGNGDRGDRGDRRDRGDRGDRGDRDDKGPRRRGRQARSLEYVDYKDVGTLRKYMSGHGKIHSRKRNGTDAKSQRKVSAAVKYARFLGLLSYTN